MCSNSRGLLEGGHALLICVFYFRGASAVTLSGACTRLGLLLMRPSLAARGPSLHLQAPASLSQLGGLPLSLADFTDVVLMLARENVRFYHSLFSRSGQRMR